MAQVGLVPNESWPQRALDPVMPQFQMGLVPKGYGRRRALGPNRYSPNWHEPKCATAQTDHGQYFPNFAQQCHAVPTQAELRQGKRLCRILAATKPWPQAYLG